MNLILTEEIKKMTLSNLIRIYTKKIQECATHANTQPK